jgi:enterochelin esterase-like enzyme
MSTLWTSLAPRPKLEHMALGLRLRPVQALLAAIAVAWVAFGLWGGFVYVQQYNRYRGFPKPVTPAGIPRGTLRTISFHSGAINGQNRYLIYLPPGYAAAAAAGKRFPVLYLLHGVPGKMSAFTDVGAADVRANVLIAQHKIPPMILVMPAGEQGLSGDTEWANTRNGKWMSFVRDVVRNVDHRFATLRNRQYRGIAGDSEGAYAAINIALHNLKLFSVAQSWSGYFVQQPAGPFAGASPAVLRANSPAYYLPAVASQVRKLGLRAYLYQGIGDLHTPHAIEHFSAMLHAAGARVRYGFFPGGHDWGLWRAQVPRMLVAAGRWFEQRPTSGGAGQLRTVGKPLSHAEFMRRRHLRQKRCLAIHYHPGMHVKRTCLNYRKQVLGHY